MKENKIQNKIIHFLEGELASAAFFLIVGVFLILFPVQTVDVFCRIVFGILLVFAGVYNIGMYLSDRVKTTVFNMFAGVIVLVLGWFLFQNPQIVIKLIPGFLGALVLVDSVWMIRTAVKFHKMEIANWNVFLIASIISIVLGILMMVNPFSNVRHTILFAGIVLVVNGAADVIFYMIRKNSIPDAPAGFGGGDQPSAGSPGNPSGTDLSVGNAYEDVLHNPSEEKTSHGLFHRSSEKKSEGVLKGLKKRFGGSLEEERHFGDVSGGEGGGIQPGNVFEDTGHFGNPPSAEISGTAGNEVLEEWKD